MHPLWDKYLRRPLKGSDLKRKFYETALLFKWQQGNLPQTGYGTGNTQCNWLASGVHQSFISCKHHCVTRAPLLLRTPLLLLEKSWVQQLYPSKSVSLSVKDRWHLTISPGEILHSIYKGTQALYWPSTIKNQRLQPYTDSVPPSTNHSLVSYTNPVHSFIT